MSLSDSSSDQSTIEVEEQVRLIHASAVQLVLAITGGGSRAIAELLERPGGSRVLLEAVVPYHSAAFIDFLQSEPEQFCSARTARLMAMAAYQRGERLQAKPAAQTKVIGVGCTASLTSDRPKRGSHRIHAAYQTNDATVEFSLVLVKGRRTRLEEEAVATRIVLNATSEACGGLRALDLGTRQDEPLAERRHAADGATQELLHGRRRQLLIGRAPILATGERRAVFPGAFNPLHDGHREIARIAGERLGRAVEFEISIYNVDKPPIDYLEIRDRAGQFSEEQTLWLTRAPTFDEKTRIFPDATFIVGADTMARIADPAYYGGSERAMLAAIERITERGARFLVFGRSGSGQAFQTLDSLALPPSLLAIADEVPETDFRSDISSTALRKEIVQE